MNKTIELLIDTYASQYQLNSHYVNRYKNFINACLKKQFAGNSCFHSHHIFPKSWSKRLGISVNNNSEDLIDLPYDYHVVAHHIIAKSGDGRMKGALKTLIGWQNIDFDLYFKTGIRLYIIRQAYELFLQEKSKPVVNLNTQKRYTSIAEAAKASNVSSTAIAKACNAGTRVKNCFWCFEDDIEQSIENTLQKYEQQAQIRKQQWLQRHNDAVLKATARAVINLNTGEAFDTITLAGQKYDTAIGNILTAIKQKTLCCNCYWAYSEQVQDRQSLLKQYQNEYKKRNDKSWLKKKVVNLDTQQVFEGMTEAVATINCTKTTLSAAIRTKRRCDGYYWAFLKDIEASGLTIEQYRQQLINQITQKHNKIGYREKNDRRVINLNTGEVFDTAIEGCRKYNLSETSVGIACKKHQKAGGYYWAYVKDVPDEQTRINLLEQYAQQKLQGKQRSQQAATAAVRKPVVNLNTGEVYESALKAGLAIGAQATSISGCIKHKIKRCGYYWAYKDDVDNFGREVLLQQYIDNKAQKAKKDYLAEPIINLNTGETFESIAAATKQLGCAKASISRSITLGIKVRECYFAKVSDLQQSGLTQQQYLQKLIDQTNHRESERQKTHWKSVINLDTLQTYPSARHLELAKGKTNSTASAAVRNHRLYCGEKWVWLEEYQKLGLQACLKLFDK